MKKYFKLSVSKRVLIIICIYLIFTILNFYAIKKASYLAYESYGYNSYDSSFYLSLWFIGISRIIKYLLTISAFIFGYIDFKKTYKVVSLKDVVFGALILSILFGCIEMIVQFPLSGFLTFTHYLGAFILTFLYIFLFYWIIIYFMSVWVIFEKAGEKGWKSLIPFYNIFILLKITEKPDWWFFLFLIPIVNIIFACMVHYELAKKFNKYDDFALGTAILPFIFYPFIAFGKDEYQK